MFDSGLRHIGSTDDTLSGGCSQVRDLRQAMPASRLSLILRREGNQLATARTIGFNRKQRKDSQPSGIYCRTSGKLLDNVTINYGDVRI